MVNLLGVRNDQITREVLMKTWKIAFHFEVEPAENGYIVKWRLEGKPKEGFSAPDYEDHTLVQQDPQGVLYMLKIAASEVSKVLDSKLLEDSFIKDAAIR